jgi:hypothetical protein
MSTEVTGLSTEDALRAYAAMMNTLDVRGFEPLLADDFHYASQWVFAEIGSKHEYLDYITKKLEALKGSDFRIWAEMGHIEESFAVLSHGWGAPCVAMAQGEKDNVISLVFAEVKSGTLQRMDMCLPELYRWQRTGDLRWSRLFGLLARIGTSQPRL